VYNLKFNYPSSPEEALILKHLLADIPAKELTELLPFPSFAGRLQRTEELGKLMGFVWEDMSPFFNLVVCNSGNQASSCILSALRGRFDKVIAEPFTYPAFKLLAAANNYQVEAATFDDNGMTPEGLLEAIERWGARLVYLQPTIHNPTCAVMPLQRRLEIVRLAREKDLYIIEDDAYRFLHPSPPASFFQLMPERTFHIFSFSKPFNPLIKTAFVFSPVEFTPWLIEEVRLSSSGPSSLSMYLADRLLMGDRLGKLIRQKQEMAVRRQGLAALQLAGLNYITYDTSFHIWIPMQPGVSSTEKTMELYRMNVLVADGVDAATGYLQHGFIRVALGAEGEDRRLREALQIVCRVLTG
jgi:DNA-binding transcriptional MocR family regulator